MEQSIGDKAAEILERRDRAVDRLLNTVRPLEPLLRDLNHNNSADRLAAALGELDALDAEMRAWIGNNTKAIVLEMMAKRFPPL